MKKKALSLLLVLVMVFSMLPVSTSAENVGDGTSEHPYEIGDTVTNDGSAEPEGSKVENGKWQVSKVVPPSSVLKCEKAEHSHGDGECDLGTKSVACEDKHESADGDTYSHADGTVCTYDAEAEQWLKTVPGDECILEEHTHSNDECYETVSGYTVWELVENITEDAPVLLSDDPVTYTVTFTVQYTSDRGTRPSSNVKVSIVDADGNEVVDSKSNPISPTTDNSGKATCSLPAGTYTASVSYTSGNYDYKATETFTVSDQAVQVTLTASPEYSYSSAKNTYDKTTYFNHVDIRVNGTFSDGTTTYNIKLQDVKVTLDYHDSANTTQTKAFNSTTTYEWRWLNLRVPKTAVITITCKIVDGSGNVLKEKYEKVFQGEADFIQAIQQCDGHQGLDFIINAQEILQAIFYDVSYQWTVYGVDGKEVNPAPACMPALPATTTDYKSDDEHTVDTKYYKGYQVTDAANGVVYTFSGWEKYQVGDGEKQAVTDTKVTVTDDIVIYGVWTASKIEEDIYVFPDLTVLKVRDANREPLAGAKFALINSDGETVKEATTDESGTLTFESLGPGRYTLREVEAPATYAANNTGYDVRVKLDHDSDQSFENGVYVTYHYYDVTIEFPDDRDDVFDADENQLTVLNTKSVGSLTIKKFFGNNNAYTPDKIKVMVAGPEGYSNTVTLNEDNEWMQTLTGLTFGEYTVTEEATVAGYPLHPDNSVTTATVILSSGVKDDVDQADQTVVLLNTYTEEVVNPASFTVIKVDENGTVISTGAEFTLYSDEECTEVAATAETDEYGVATFSGFKKEATYYLKETKAPEGYQLSDSVWVITIELQDGDPFVELDEENEKWLTIYNWDAKCDQFKEGSLRVTNAKKLGSLTVTKEVNDDEGLYGNVEYSFTLKRSDQTNDQTFTLKAGEKKIFDNIPWGTTYTLTESAEGAAFTSIITDDGNGVISKDKTAITVTNTYEYVDLTESTPLILNKVEKENGTTLSGAGFTVFADERCKEQVSEEVFSDADGKVQLPITSEGTYYLKETTTPTGYQVNDKVYTVTARKVYAVKNAGTEDAVTEIRMAITVEELTGSENAYTVENTSNKTSVSVNKVWNDEKDLAGFRPESVQVQLYKTVNNQTSVCGDPVTLSEDGRWRYEWKDLPVMEAGQRISYSVSEVAVPDHYDAAISIGAGNVFVLTNTHAPEKTNITITKTWNDGNDLDGLRPSSVKVTLYRNGTKVETVTLSEKNDWKYTFKDMQVYADGEKANYTVTETKVDNYQPKVTYTENPNTGLAIDIVNSYTPEQTSVTVTKKWTDSSNKDGDRPASVTIYLLANGEKTGDELVLNSANKWTGSFDNLPVKKDGKTIKYTVSEKSVANYTAKITGTAAKGFVVTNTHTSIPVTGDESNLVLYAALFAIGAAAVFSALILSKKKFGKRS